MSKQSAVVVLHEKRSDSVILTQRSKQLRHHPGEICFPGGRWEWADPNLWSTALRELHEELGIAPARVQLIKELEAVHTLLGTIIHPWLAEIDSIDPYIMNEHEVTAILSLPMQAVITSSNYQEIEFVRFGKTIKSWQFMPSEEVVWGATAKIMRQLCE